MPVEKVQQDTTLEIESGVEARIVVHAPGCTIRIGHNVQMTGGLWVRSPGALIDIADNCNIGGAITFVAGPGGVLRIGQGTTITAAGISFHEAGEIIIGERCMFSTDIHMDVSDMHPIFDRASGRRINPASSIHIDDEVWLGARVMVLKGAHIGRGTVVGAGAIVTGDLPAHVLAVGAPARVVRENIAWRRDFTDSIDPEEPPPAAHRASPLDFLRRRRSTT